jgi:uncharacterized protein
MSDIVLERMISTYMATEQPQYAFGWQGGEPVLMGIDFFKRAVELQKKYGRGGASVANGLQTNATLINDEFAKLFSQYNFLVGVSLDGPKEVHDYYRTNAKGHSSHKDVLRGIECLKRNRVEFNALVLINSKNVKQAKKIYHYLCEKGIFYHQYIPCVEFDNDGRLMSFSITGKEWGNFLCGIFDQWSKGDMKKVSIRFFDSILNLLVTGKSSICHMERNCCQYFVVEYNGDIYPCDFFVKKELKLGNIKENSWEQMQRSSKYFEFGRQKTVWHNRCDGCEYVNYCSGGCLKYRLYPPRPNDPRQLSWLCEGWKKFYRHSLFYFKDLALSIKEKGVPGEAADMSGKREIGRNDPCSCGSGKKYKKCCGR